MAIGLLAYTICLIGATALFGYNSTTAAGAGVGIMSAMVMAAAKEGYGMGRRTQTVPGDASLNEV